jgi:hypothetical protein
MKCHECESLEVKWEVSYSKVPEDRISCCHECFLKFHNGESIVDQVFLGSQGELDDLRNG